MEAPVTEAELSAQSNALSSQAMLNKNTASQPPTRDIITTASLYKVTPATLNDVTASERTAATSHTHIVTAAQNSLERAIAASQALPKTTESLERATVINHSHKPQTVVAPVNVSQSSTLPTQLRNVETAAQVSSNVTTQNSLERPSNKYIPQQTTVNNTIVTSQGMWQNVTAPSLPDNTLPAVQDFLLKAFETVQRSKQMAMATPNNTLQGMANPRPPLLASPIAQNALPIAFVTTQLSPQTSLPSPITSHPRLLIATPAVVTNSLPVVPFGTTPISPQTSMRAPFQSFQRMNSLPNNFQDTSKPQSSLPDKTILQSKQTATSPHESTSLEQSPSINENKKSSVSQIGTISKSQSHSSSFTFYNSTLQNSKQLSPPKRPILVAKRQNPVPKTKPETENSVRNPTSEVLLANLTPKAHDASEKRNIKESAKDSPVKQNSCRVAQTFKERARNGPQTSQSVTETQNAQPKGSYRNWRQYKTNVDNAEEIIDPKIRVLVSGFPPYTQSQDVIRVMSRFGNCQVESCRNRLAVVLFETEKEAKTAMKSTNEINIYGEFIEIKPYTNPKHVDDLYKAFKKVITTQKGQDITMPKDIDLTGDFFQQMENIQKAIRLTREEAQSITNLYGDLEMVLQQEWPGCVAIPFGSIPTGLGIKSSDADCFVKLPEAYRARNAAGGGAATFVTRTRRILQQYPNVFTHLIAIPRANTPIVKFRHVPSGFHCDVSAKTPLGAQNSKLIKLLLEHDDRLANVAVLIKYWAKVHELSGTGKLTNYALTMMVIFYLQQPAVGLVPAVERLQRDPTTRYIVDHWNAGFSPRKLPGPTNPVAVPDLLGGFFVFYGSFDFDKLVVCPYLGVAVPKVAFENPHTLPLEFSRYVGNVRDNLASPIRYTTAFCVQDPFEQSHNVASSVCPKLSAEICAYIKFAAETYTADHPNGCRNFLRTILLTKPKLRLDRLSPTTNVALIPRVRGQIADEDWHAVVREIILDLIFKKILKLHLRREDTDQKKDHGRRKVEREKYSCSARKPVWRRKKANRSLMSYSETPDQLIARQMALTEEILSNATVTMLQFEIELWFREDPKNCNLGFKMIDGDMEAFRHFVSFLHTFMVDWFRVLLKPHLTYAKEDAQSDADRKADCTIKFEKEPARPPSPPRLVLDPTDITRELNAVTLDTDTDSSDSSKKESH